MWRTVFDLVLDYLPSSKDHPDLGGYFGDRHADSGYGHGLFSSYRWRLKELKLDISFGLCRPALSASSYCCSFSFARRG